MGVNIIICPNKKRNHILKNPLIQALERSPMQIFIKCLLKPWLMVSEKADDDRTVFGFKMANQVFDRCVCQTKKSQILLCLRITVAGSMNCDAVLKIRIVIEWKYGSGSGLA